jgi:hypothetical protein
MLKLRSSASIRRALHNSASRRHNVGYLRARARQTRPLADQGALSHRARDQGGAAKEARAGPAREVAAHPRRNSSNGATSRPSSPLTERRSRRPSAMPATSAWPSAVSSRTGACRSTITSPSATSVARSSAAKTGCSSAATRGRASTRSSSPSSPAASSTAHRALGLPPRPLCLLPSWPASRVLELARRDPVTMGSTERLQAGDSGVRWAAAHLRRQVLGRQNWLFLCSDEPRARSSSP